MPPEPLSDVEVERLRAELPALGRMVYFVSNGLGVLPRRSAEAVARRARELSENAIVSALFENPPLVDEVRGRAARLLGADADEIAFSRNTTEALLWAASGLPLAAGDEVLVAQGESPSNVLPWLTQRVRGVETRLFPQRERRIPPALVAEQWGPRTRVLAISWVQWNTGFRADLAALARLAHERDAWLVCDAIQGLGALRLDVREAGIDLLAAGTYKWLLGVQGQGLFYCRRALLSKLLPVHVGPGGLADPRDPEDPDAPYDVHFADAARRFEEGTRSYLGLAALRESLAWLEEIGIDRIEARVLALTDRLAAEIERRGGRVLSPRGPGERSGIVLFTPPSGAPPAAELAPALHARGFAINAREGALHAGLHFYNTGAEVDRLFEAIDEIAAAARTEGPA
jgi:cysteine desulfurase/selenocysteine lyase